MRRTDNTSWTDWEERTASHPTHPWPWETSSTSERSRALLGIKFERLISKIGLSLRDQDINQEAAMLVTRVALKHSVATNESDQVSSIISSSTISAVNRMRGCETRNYNELQEVIRLEFNDKFSMFNILIKNARAPHEVFNFFSFF